MSVEPPSAFARTAAQVTVVWLLVMIGGMYGAASGWRPGAYLTIAAVLGYNVSHLAIGVSEYRRVMQRPWPEVPPLDDDEW